VPRRGSPRVKHDTKITVYLSQQELIALEQARLTLRAEHDLRVDRGRLVREAVAVMLADLEASGPESVLVRRLSSDDEEAEQAEPTDADGPEETVAWSWARTNLPARDRKSGGEGKLKEASR